MPTENFKAYIVALILDGKPEDALELLSKEYNVTLPSLRVGLPKGHKTTAYGCYSAKTQSITVLNSDILINPFVILHEFYHHLRSKAVDRVHRGTEGNADKFAMDYLQQYQLAVLRAQLGSQ